MSEVDAEHGHGEETTSPEKSEVDAEHGHGEETTSPENDESPMPGDAEEGVDMQGKVVGVNSSPPSAAEVDGDIAVEHVHGEETTLPENYQNPMRGDEEGLDMQVEVVDHRVQEEEVVDVDLVIEKQNAEPANLRPENKARRASGE
jgi:hypothetical protein